jgi:argininosuccinate synthase
LKPLFESDPAGLNKLGGKHDVGRVDVVEDRVR